MKKILILNQEFINTLSLSLSLCLSLCQIVCSLFALREWLANNELQSFGHLGWCELHATFREVPKFAIDELLFKDFSPISNLGFDGIDRLSLLSMEFLQTIVDVLVTLPEAAESLQLVADFQSLSCLLPLASLLLCTLSHQICSSDIRDLLLPFLVWWTKLNGHYFFGTPLLRKENLKKINFYI